MTYAQFFILLGLTTALALAGIFGFHAWLDLDYAWVFSLVTLALFLLVSVVLFFFGKRTAGADNRHLFGNVFLAGTLLKMMLCGTLLFVYVLLGEPRNKLFVAPFFWQYFLFTGLEVYVLMKLARVVKPAVTVEGADAGGGVGDENLRPSSHNE